MEEKTTKLFFWRGGFGNWKHRTSLQQSAGLLRQNIGTFHQRSPMFSFSEAVTGTKNTIQIARVHYPPPKKGETRHRKKKAGNASEENGKTKIVLHMAFKSTMMQNEKDYFLLKCQTFYHKTMYQPSIFLRKSLNLHHQAHGFRLISAIHHTFNYKVY